MQIFNPSFYRIRILPMTYIFLSINGGKVSCSEILSIFLNPPVRKGAILHFKVRFFPKRSVRQQEEIILRTKRKVWGKLGTNSQINLSWLSIVVVKNGRHFGYHALSSSKNKSSETCMAYPWAQTCLGDLSQNPPRKLTIWFIKKQKILLISFLSTTLVYKNDKKTYFVS